MNLSPVRLIPLPALLINKDKLEIIEGNDLAAELTGINIKMLTGMNGAEFFPDSEFGPMDFKRVLFRNASGEKFQVDLNIQIYNEEKQACYIFTFQKREHQFQDLMDGTSDGIIITDEKLNVVNVNPAFCSIAELDRELLVGNNGITLARSHIPTKALDLVLPALKKMASGNAVPPFEIEYKGKILKISSRNPKGPKFYIGIVKDISEERKAQKAAKISEEKFRFFAESTFEGVVVHNRGIVLDINESFTNLTGFTSEELLGKNLLEYIPGRSDRARMIANMLKRKSKPFHVTAKKKDGSKFIVEIEAKEVMYMGEKARISAIRDVTKQIALQNKLKESEERYRTVFEKTGTAIVIIENDRLISLANTRFAKLVGYPTIEIENKKQFTDFVVNEDISKMISWHESRRQNPEQTPKDYEFRLIDRYKNLKYISLFVDLIPGTNQSIASLIEITERKKALLELKESEGRLKKAQSIATMGNWSINLNTSEASGSEETREIYGLSEKTMSSEILKSIHLPEYLEMLDSAMADLIAGKNNYDLEFKLKNQLTGQIIDVRSIAEYNADENIVSGVIQDISRRKHAESLNNQREQYLQSIFRAAPVGIGVVIDRHFTAVNKKLCELTAYSEKELINMPSRMLYANENDYDYVGKEKYREIEKRGTGTVETQWKCKDGIVKDILLSSTPIDPHDLQRGVTFTALDITERKKAEKDLLSNNKELILARDQAEESDRLKTAFLANMSHEIRTPMNGIIGFTNLLYESSITTETRNSYIDIIKKSGDRLLVTVNDLIDISRLEAGEVKMDILDTGINELLENLKHFFLRETNEKGLELHLHKPLSDQEMIIRADEQKVNSVLTNLVKNSIKYTHEGSIEFGYNKRENTNGLILEFFVKDTGIGIPKNRQQAVFNRFEQADIEDRFAYEGSGLGLTIAKSLVNLMEGEIWMESSINKGSTFFFTIPYISSGEKIPVGIEGKSVKKNDPMKGNLKILIAEDDMASFRHLSIVLKDLSKEIIHASSGIEAVKACQDNHDIDLVLMDVKMPNMNGLEATRQIREFNSSVIIIAQTAYALAGDKEKALGAGCNDYLTKPIKKDELLNKLSYHTDPGRS